MSQKRTRAKLKRRGIKTASAKGKARRLQQWFRDRILASFNDLTEADVRSVPMGTPGADVQLSQAALIAFPYAVECKNQQAVNVWKAMEQATTHAKGTQLEPLVVIKRNQSKQLVLVDAEHFVKLTAAVRRRR